jgi:Nif-specific regulatory protein
MRRKKLGAILIERGLITDEQLREALTAQAKEGGLIGQILIRRGQLAEEDLISALSIQFDLNLLYDLFDQSLAVSDPATRDDIRHKIQRLSLLLKSIAAISAERDFDFLLELLCREAATVLGAERTTIFLLDQQKKEVWSRVALGLEKTMEIRVAAGRGIVGHVIKTGQMVNVPDAYADPRFNREVDEKTGYKTKNLLAAPLRTKEGKVLGSFQVVNKLAGAFTVEDEELLQFLASQAATAIENAQYFEDLRRAQDSLVRENATLREQVGRRFNFANIVGVSGKLQEALRLVNEICDSPVNVLVTGESGTGKELIAKTIHYNSSRREAPFVALNCAALPETLLESELFGIEKGVATGVERRAGKMELANGGTLFLDEIGDMSPPMQAKMLRALQEREVVRVGGVKPIPVDIRVLAATNRDLKADIGAGKFREDLYYRLNVVNIHIPPLRERREDIPLLVDFFLGQARERLGKNVRRFSSEAMDLLKAYNWPGNVRELENEVVRAVALSGGAQVIGKEVLSEKFLEGTAAKFRKYKQLGAMPATVQGIEMEMISEYLEKTGGNKERAAKLLGISREGLRKKMKKYGMSGA